MTSPPPLTSQASHYITRISEIFTDFPLSRKHEFSESVACGKIVEIAGSLISMVWQRQSKVATLLGLGTTMPQVSNPVSSATSRTWGSGAGDGIICEFQHIVAGAQADRP
jgi:hypothetical protein